MDKSTYELLSHELFGESIMRTDLNGEIWSIPLDPANSDYQAYLAQLEETE
jgi:hypothetical protein